MNYFRKTKFRETSLIFVAIKNYCRDFGVDPNELATLAIRFLEEEYKDKKKTA